MMCDCKRQIMWVLRFVLRLAEKMAGAFESLLGASVLDASGSKCRGITHQAILYGHALKRRRLPVGIESILELSMSCASCTLMTEDDVVQLLDNIAAIAT